MIQHSFVDDAVQTQPVQLAYSGIQAAPRAAQHSTQVAATVDHAVTPLPLQYETFLSSLFFVMASIVALAELTRVISLGRRKMPRASS